MLALGFTGRPGWVEVSEPGLEARVWINVIEEGGRYHVGTLIVNGKPVDAATLRRIPLSRIEALLNRPEAGVGAGVTSSEVAQATSELAGPAMQTFTEEFHDIEQALASLLTGPVAGPAPAEAAPRERAPLRRPTGADPETFYQQVAEAYSALVGETSRPAKAMAEEAEVPVTTVHRWIHEARRRVYLSPARKGRAG